MKVKDKRTDKRSSIQTQAELQCANKPDMHNPLYMCVLQHCSITDRRTEAYVLKRTNDKFRKHSVIQPRWINSEPLDLENLHIFLSLYTACPRSYLNKITLVFQLTEEHWLRMFENREQSKVFGPKGVR